MESEVYKMKKEYVKKKKLVIFILAVAAVCLAGGLCLYLAKIGTPAEPDAETRQEGTGQTEVTVPEIDIPEQTVAPEETKPGETVNSGEETEPVQSGDPEITDSRTDGDQTGDCGENPRTREDAQAPSEKPKPVDGDAAEDPGQPPQYEPEITEPEQKPAEPAGGSTNGNGQVYVPGFGYVDPPGAPQGESAGSDGDWNKQIGDMN